MQRTRMKGDGAKKMELSSTLTIRRGIFSL